MEASIMSRLLLFIGFVSLGDKFMLTHDPELSLGFFVGRFEIDCP